MIVLGRKHGAKFALSRYWRWVYVREMSELPTGRKVTLRLFGAGPLRFVTRGKLSA